VVPVASDVPPCPEATIEPQRLRIGSMQEPRAPTVAVPIDAERYAERLGQVGRCENVGQRSGGEDPPSAE